MKLTFALIAVTSTWAMAAEPPLPAALKRAHSHNDYLHARPLADALAHGFASVEVDVFLVEGKLLVAHDVLSLDRRRTIEAMYLDPLRERFRAGGGKLFADATELILLVDFKSQAEPTYEALAKVLANYSEMLAGVKDGERKRGAVCVIISGYRPIERVAKETDRLAFIDGRLADLESDRPALVMPLVSDNWTLHFKWDGRGAMPDAERRKLHDAAARAHAVGRKLRFWRTPETVEMWRELVAANVDLINTDRLAELGEFLRAESKGAPPP